MGTNRNERALVPLARVPFEEIEVFMLALIAAAISLLHLTSATLARDEGRYQNADPTIKAWIRGLTDKNGNGCCDTADGYPAEVEWDNRTGRYRVRIDGQWHVVPDDAVIETPNRLGYPMVWYYQVQIGSQSIFKIRCFLPGAGG